MMKRLERDMDTFGSDDGERNLLIERRVSGALMVANLVAMILVISIHYHSKSPPDAAGAYDWNQLLQSFLIDGVARIAVPFFALISGFFLATKIRGFEGYIAVLKNKFRTLFIPYIVASGSILAAVLILKMMFARGIVQGFSVYSLFYDVIVHPVSIHMWFLRDLIVLTVVSPLILGEYRFLDRAICLFLGVLWFFEIQLFPIVGGWYIVSIETVFFFSLGGLVSRQRSILTSIVDARLLLKFITLAIWLILISFRVHLEPEIDLWYVRHFTLESIMLYKLAILVGMIVVFQFSVILADSRRIVYLSGLTFFAYMYHSIPLSYFRDFTGRIVSYPFSFYLDFPIAVVVVFSAAHGLSRWCPRFYAWITGGRDPKKALKRVSER